MTAQAAAYLLERAWVDGAVHDGVLVEIEAGRFTRVVLPRGNSRFPAEVSAGMDEIHRVPGETHPTRLPGLTLPGLANCHSHAFHRALRGRTQTGRGTFWTWREQMYAVAGRLDPDSYFALARATYREMAASGITTVGEFHYLHHQPDGTPYDDPNEMGHALIQAAQDAGIRIALLDTCYLSSGFGKPVEGVQVRYSDGDIDGWSARQDALESGLSPERRQGGPVVLGSAIHSVRAVPREALARIAERAGGSPIHVHLSEQRAENQECLTAYGMTPTALLHDAGVLGPEATAVHATHLTDADIALLGQTRTNSCFCPTTERDLGDGIGPSRRLHTAGSPITLGSDSHAVIDLFEEMRALEMDERLATEQRGHWSAAELLNAGTRHPSLGFADAGTIAVGQRADLVTLDTTTVRTAGTGADENTATFAATAADVTQVLCDGRVVFSRGDEGEIGRELEASIQGLRS
ncbi:formimidoylglutamate deiminase [Nocardioides sp.]|uniref:formimidoylglutamate deiminase n=1 Tax=Nocardioides sp. TaxID=35761 RepID=UPI003564B07D